jgi:hypothetical protein
MKKLTIVFMALIAGFVSFGQTAADTTAIKETVMNYLEGFYTADGVRMEKALHPDLAKRVVFTNPSGNSYVQNMTAMALYQYTKSKKDESAEHGKLAVSITIFDIFENIATVKATTEYFPFIDYCQLGKVNGDWKIINVLWAMKPKD